MSKIEHTCDEVGQRLSSKPASYLFISSHSATTLPIPLQKGHLFDAVGKSVLEHPPSAHALLVTWSAEGGLSSGEVDEARP